MKNQKNRSMKVYSQNGRNYKATPTIILKGQWLEEMGFMEKETKKLQKRFQREKEELYAQFVAEKKAQYMTEKEER